MSRWHAMRVRSLVLVMCSAAVWGVRGADEGMTIEALVAYAFEHSPELHKLEISVDTRKAQTIIEEARFAWMLDYDVTRQVDARRTENRVTLSKQIVGGFQASATSSFSLAADADSAYVSVSISKKLLGSDASVEATRRAIEDSLLEELISLNDLNQAKRRLVYQVGAAFYKVLRDTQSMHIQELRLERAKRNLEMAIERERPLDIITARIQIPENELAVVQTSRAIETGLEALRVLIGMPVASTLQISDRYDFSLVDIDVQRDIQYALENHEDMVNIRLRRRKAERDVRIARSDLWPDVKVSATHRADSSADSFSVDEGSTEQTVSMSLSWEILRRSDKARYRQVLNRLRTNERDTFILEQQRAARLAELGRQLDETSRSIDLQQQRITLVTRQVELYKDRYDNGEIDILEFIRSQNDLENSKVELIKQQTSYLELLALYNFEAGR